MMPLHHRRKPADANNNNAAQEEEEEIEQPKTSTSWSSSSSSSPAIMQGRNNNIKIGLLLLLQLIMMGYASTKVKKTNKSSMKHMILVLVATTIASIPIILSLAVGLGLFTTKTTTTDLPHQRYIPLVVVITIIANQLPIFISSGIAACGIVLFGLSSRPINSTSSSSSSSSPSSKNYYNKSEEGNNNNNNNKQSKEKETIQKKKKKKPIFDGPLGAVLAVILMTIVLLTENFFIWIVSATYPDGYTNIETLPKPLQDNGQIILRYLFGSILELSKREISTLRNMINVEWILVSGLGLSLVAIELQGTKIKRNLWSLALRALFTMTMARCIRTISFLITVLPSQNPTCYYSHFPFPPPTLWFDWLLVGFIPQANGGCNDLIISGHATVTSTLACVVTSVVNKPIFTISLWMFVAMDYMVEIYEGFHYSVDMWLGAVLVNLIWTAFEPIETQQQQQQQDHPSSSLDDRNKNKQFHPIQDSTKYDILIYSLPAIGSYVQVNGFVIPVNQANYTIVIYILFVASQIVQFGFQHYTQHVLFCLLYMALGIYL